MHARGSATGRTDTADAKATDRPRTHYITMPRRTSAQPESERIEDVVRASLGGYRPRSVVSVNRIIDTLRDEHAGITSDTDHLARRISDVALSLGLVPVFDRRPPRHDNNARRTRHRRGGSFT